jgi:unsaturated rhamnogalacturonyl hydrolase
MYKVTENVAYLDYMNREWWTTSSKLWDAQEHLFLRDESYLLRKEANGKKLFWARGNGWVMGDWSACLNTFPTIIRTAPSMLCNTRRWRQGSQVYGGSDGLWRPGLLDENAYPLPKTSGSAFFTYALAWRMNEGVVDASLYRPVVEKAWKELLSHIYADGRLGCVQPVGAAPNSYKPTSSYTYGVGAFLLAGSEVHRLTQ